MPRESILPERRPKVLIVAPNASSAFGGEAYIPLQYFRSLRKRNYPARMITHARNRDNLKIDAAPWHDDITYISDTWLHRILHRWSARLPAIVAETLFGSLMAMLDAHLQGRIIRRMIATDPPDIIHQPTPVSPMAPSGLHRFGLPLVIGPMNGGMNYPPGYDHLQGRAERSIVRVSRLIAWGANRIAPGKRHASMLLVANERTRAALPFRAHPHVRTLVENGIDVSTWQAPRSKAAVAEADRNGMRLAYVGRLVDWKMVDVTLEAVLATTRCGRPVTIDIVGDGPERGRLEALTRHLGLSDLVSFRGFRTQDDCAAILSEVDALILNSVRECGGAVVLEAMAMGLPVIASRWGGPIDYLDESCGILVSPIPAHDFADRLAEAIRVLATNPDMRRRLGAAGRRRAHQLFDWKLKVDEIVAIYAEVVERAPGGSMRRHPEASLQPS